VHAVDRVPLSVNRGQLDPHRSGAENPPDSVERLPQIAERAAASRVVCCSVRAIAGHTINFFRRSKS
jgi:hypothetical protein